MGAVHRWVGEEAEGAGRTGGGSVPAPGPEDALVSGGGSLESTTGDSGRRTSVA